jgi:BirA family biotin operon repressor/biotin-[acetyl-CoA-carboxylase] ligase
VVVGVGLNVTTRRAELPEGAVSLLTEGAGCTDRDPLLRAILRTLADRYAEWAAGPDRLRPAYEAVCDTIGQDVRVQLPGGGALAGTATGLDEMGRLVVRTTDGGRAGVRRRRHPGPPGHCPVTFGSSDGHT